MADKFSHSVVQCLAAIAQHRGIQVNPERLIHEFALADEEPSAALVSRMAIALGMKAKVANLTWSGLIRQEGVFPLLLRLNSGGGIIVVGIKKGEEPEQVGVVDPGNSGGGVTFLSAEQFGQIWGGEVVFLKRRHSLFDIQQPFGMRWFIPEILRQRQAFRDVIVAAMSMNVLALASPMFFQIVIDKVLVHQSSSTLAVLTAGVVVALLFDAAFGYVRQILLLAATNKIDMRVTRRAFAHLLSLPIDFFELSTAGVIARQMQQLEQIRHFLTGRLLFAGMDALALVIFLPLLFTYSVKLALIVLAFTGVIAAIIGILLPTFRERLDRLNSAEGRRQALLVETIHGMRTVKALAIEPMQRKAWDQISAEAITAHFRVGKLSISGNAATDFLGKLMPVVIIFIGAQGVFEQTMTVGVLIAFQMLAGRVFGPLVQIVTLVHEYQEVGPVRAHARTGDEPGAGARRSPPRPAAQPRRRDQLRERQLPLWPGRRARPRRHLLPGPRGFGGRHRRTQRLGQDDADAPHPGPIPRPGRAPSLRGVRQPRDRPRSLCAAASAWCCRTTFCSAARCARTSLRQAGRHLRGDRGTPARPAGADEFIERLPHGYDTLLEENALQPHRRPEAAALHRPRAAAPSPRL